MLWWKRQDREYYLCLSGKEEIASVIQLESTKEWGFQILDRETTQGTRLTLKEAKSAAEAAFTEWLQSASLVHLPDGYVIVPEEPTPEMCNLAPSLPAIHATKDLWMRDAGYSMNGIQNYKRYRAMLAAANKRGDSPYAPGHPKNITGEGVDGDSVATTGRGAAANTAQDGREGDG